MTDSLRTELIEKMHQMNYHLCSESKDGADAVLEFMNCYYGSDEITISCHPNEVKNDS